MFTNQSNTRDAFNDRSTDRPIPIGLDTTLRHVDRIELMKIGMITVIEQKQDQSLGQHDDTANQHLPTISIPEKRSSDDHPIKPGYEGKVYFDGDPNEDLTGGGKGPKSKETAPKSESPNNPTHPETIIR